MKIRDIALKLNHWDGLTLICLSVIGYIGYVFFLFAHVPSEYAGHFLAISLLCGGLSVSLFMVWYINLSVEVEQ